MFSNIYKTILITFIFPLAIGIIYTHAEEYANDIDTTYKFSAIKAPESPYKNTWSSFQNNLSTGSFGYSYNIETPPGTNGLTPKITLGYNSHARGKAGWVGAGWEIPLTYIQRDIEFTRIDISDDTFDLYLNGGKSDLVFMPSDFRYHTKIESYMRIERLTGALNETGEYWLVTAKDGTQFRFGYNTDSENILNTSDPNMTTPFVWRWSLDQIQDTNGNTVFFSYTENPANGEVYLSRIEYNNDRKRVVEFILEDREDVYLFVDQGSEITETQRLKEIKTWVNGDLTKRYVLDYQINFARNKSLLTTITLYGEDGTSSLPPVRFEYNPLNIGFEGKQDWNTPGSGRQWIRRVDHKSNTIVDTFDVDGDLRPDLIKAKTDDDHNDYWEVYKNTGTGFSENAAVWKLPPGWNDIRDIRRSQSLDKGANTRSAPMDINRDGLLDIARANSSDVLEYELNNGTDFSDRGEIALPIDDVWIRRVRAPDYADKETRKAPNVKQAFIDFNGDGYPDLVQRKEDYFGDKKHAWHIWRFTGSEFADFGYWAVDNEWIEDFERDDNDVESTTADMNGDGLTDIIWGSDKKEWRVYINTGSQFRYIGNWLPPGIEDDDIIDIQDYDDRIKAANTKRTLQDFNGDGLPDVVHAQQGSGGVWDVYLNTGNGFTEKIAWQTPVDDEYVSDMTYDGETDPEELETRARRDLLDINGDGSPDIVKSTDDGYWEVWLNKSVQADMLKKVTDTLGGTVDVAYTSSLNFDNEHFPERRLNSHYWLVSSVETDNGMGGPHATIATANFFYANGWYNFEEREFRGFSRVEEVRADGTKILHYFYQDDTHKGKERQTDTRSSSEALFGMTKNQFQGIVNGDVHISRLIQTDDYTYDGVPNNPKVIRTEYQNFDEYGNVRLEIQRGDTSVTYDDIFAYKEFFYDKAKWIVDKVSHAWITAEDGGKLRESWFEYDENGNLESEEAYLDTGDNPVTFYRHDDYGNMTEKIIKTENGNRTEARIAYDATYHTFPESTWNALNHLMRRIFDPGTGQVLTETDPNGFMTSFEFDVFGRKISEIRPGDTPEKPTVRIQYILNGTAPGCVKTSKREVSGLDGTLDTWQFIDGFGNLIQTKSEFENPANQVVSDVFYDVMGRVVRQSNPYLAAYSENYTSPDGDYFTVYQYDTLGRPVLITNPDGTQIFRIFDHWTVTESDEMGRPTTYHFNAFQKLTQVEENNGTEPPYITRYEYDPLGQIVKLTDHMGNTTLIQYDSLGRKISMDDPDMGKWYYAYDMANNLISQTDARNITTAIGYDDLNRRKKVDYPSDPDIEFFYDETIIGTLSRVADHSGTVTYYYDDRLRKTKEEQTIDGETYTTQWAYDSADRVISQIYPDGEVVFYTYNNQGKLENMPGIIANLDYNHGSQIIRKSYANGLNTDYTYHPANLRLTAMKTPDIQDFGYSYDDVGNILSIEDGIAQRVETFDYDDLDRLLHAEDAGYQADYAYNAIGNMTSETMISWSYNAKTNAYEGKVHRKTDYSYGENAGPHAVTKQIVTQLTEQPVLSVSPAFQDVTSKKGTATFTVANNGTDTLIWTASTSDSWLRITEGSSGEDQGTIGVNYEANPGAPRTGTITVTADNGDAEVVEIRQEGK